MKIKKPKYRHPLRRKIGKEFYCIKRRFQWLSKNYNWAKSKTSFSFNHEVKSHRSLILRPLKDVEMYLQENKRTNLRLAIKKLDGVVIRPGETFSFWKLVGRPTARNGYLEGLVLNQGSISKDIGGGLCQMGNLLFWIVAHSPLTITQRFRHAYDVFPDVNRNIPFGAGATLSYNYIDFQFKNNTDNSFHLKLWLDETHLNGVLNSQYKIHSTFEVEERNHKVEHQYWGGYTRHNEIFQLEKNEGVFINETLIVRNDAIMMYEPLISQSGSNKK